QQGSGQPEADYDQKNGEDDNRRIVPRVPGGAGFLRRAEQHSSDMQRDAGEDAESKQDEERAHQEVPGSKGGADHEEFTLKQAERRQPDNRHNAEAESGAGERQHAEHAALELLEKIGFEALIDIAGGKEEQRLGHGMKRHVQHQGKGAEFAADAQGGGHHAGLIDGGISQHAPEILLDQNERHRDPHGKEAEQEQQIAGILRAQAAGGEHVEADQSVDGAVQHG